MNFVRVIWQFMFGDKNYNSGRKAMAKIDGFIPGWGTTRTCLDCGRIVIGGPTRCVRCVQHGGD